jgi:hypothetical protein
MEGPSAELKLTIELVPKTCWYSNLRRKVAPAEWDRIRRDTYAAYGYRCGICGADAPLHCHERWAYDDREHRQRLLGFIALCEWCHHVKHIGLASILASEGKLDMKRVVDHFMRVNSCDRAVYRQHRLAAFQEWRRRSQEQWTVELGEYAGLIASASDPRPAA